MLLNEVEKKVHGLAVVLVWCTVLVLPGADDPDGSEGFKSAQALLACLLLVLLQ